MGRVPSRGTDQFVLRFPDGMRDRIRDEAEKNGRSMNAEMISRLELSLEKVVWDRQEFIDSLDNRQETVNHLMVQLGHSISNTNFYKDLLKTERKRIQSLWLIVDLIVENAMKNKNAIPADLYDLSAKCYDIIHSKSIIEDEPRPVNVTEIQKLEEEIALKIYNAENVSD